MNSSKEKENRKQPNPILSANFLSKWFFWWTRHVFKKGFNEKLGPDDLYEHVPNLDSKNLSDGLIKYWEIELRRKNPSLLHMIFKAYGWKLVPICVLYSLLEILIHSSQPLFLGGLVSYFSQGQTNISKHEAYLYAVGIILCTFIAALCFHPFMFYVFEIGTRIRLACAGLVYRKCLRASITADNSGMSGFAIAVLSTDLPQFDLTFYFFHDLWKGPIEAGVFGYIMYQEIGWPALIGIAAIAIFIPLQAWAAKAAAYYRKESAEHGDTRVKLMNEIISAIQVIKMYAWEKSFAKLIGNVRRQEVNAIRGSMNIYAALQCTNMISKFALFLSLLTYVCTGEVVSARKVFITSSYFDALNESLLHFWPLAITTWAETFVCAGRVVDFLLQSEDPADGGIENIGLELDDDSRHTTHGRTHNPRALRKEIVLHNVSGTWDKLITTKKCTRHIREINCHIEMGHFVGIMGNVGAGKTTLLSAILGEMEIVQGNVEVNGVVSYASQDAWIFEGTVRDNIIFVEKFDERRYETVIHACELKRDIELLPFGDETIVGERGISLSGGQKARISLARAVYRKADIYLFDDPLAAVDAHVGKRLVEKCFLKFLEGKIRVLVTHHVQYMQHANHIILMYAGVIERQGSYDELKNLLRARMQSEHEAARMSVLSNNRPQLHHLDSVVDGEPEVGVAFIPNILTKDACQGRKEQQMQGSVKFRTYMAYFKALRFPSIAICIFILFIVARVSQGVMDIFISKWATWEETLPADHESYDDYTYRRENIVVLYTILIFCTLILYLLRTFGFFTMCLRISLRLHDMLFNGIIRAYMSFFNTNTSGRILNRFSSDIMNTDVALPQAMLDSADFLVNATAVLIIVAVANYWLLIPALIVICLLLFSRRLYIGASRSLKRIESLTRSPVYSHTNQTFHGLTTIRALNATRHLEREFHGYQNSNTSALYLYVTTNRAFAFWTDLICGLYILAVVFSFLLMQRNFYSGDVGLAITQSMTLIIMCQWGMRQTAEMENNMTSVERIVEYIQTPNEPDFETNVELKLPKTWPHKGQIRFVDLHLKYNEDGPYVLKGLNFIIRPMEKIGIIGRTGAGKSSIIQAIFRLAINEGSIDIDGFDISQLGLHDLRSRISIIPQEPVLFTGTLRYNLDPFEEKPDDEMWRVLDDVELKSYVLSLEGGLDCRVYDGGANFSTGQRQLVCLARAILRHNKILIMDEATANVDPHTDKLIQDTIHANFRNCTVLTIAHRLHTVMDNDRVLVMDAGQVVELDHPFVLLQNKDGVLNKLVEKTGSTTSRHLRLLAKESYNKRVPHQAQ